MFANKFKKNPNESIKFEYEQKIHQHQITNKLHKGILIHNQQQQILI